MAADSDARRPVDHPHDRIGGTIFFEFSDRSLPRCGIHANPLPLQSPFPAVVYPGNSGEGLPPEEARGGYGRLEVPSEIGTGAPGC